MNHRSIAIDHPTEIQFKLCQPSVDTFVSFLNKGFPTRYAAIETKINQSQIHSWHCDMKTVTNIV